MKNFIALLFAIGIVCFIWGIYNSDLIDKDLLASNTTVIRENAENNTDENTENKKYDNIKTFDGIASKYEDAIKKIEKGYKNQSDSIKLRSCKITVDELEDIVKYLKTNCFYYYVESYYTYYSDGQYVTSLNPRYTMTIDKINENDVIIYSAIDEIAKKASSFKTDIEKLIYIHNYLVENIEYDNYDHYSENNVYGALVLKKTKCVGYSEAFRYIAEKAGLKTYIVSSKKLEHAWNMVNVNSKYYFVDCTWDDPVFEKINLTNDPLSGYGCYKYFMCSEANYLNNEHEADDWTVNGESIMGIAASTAYDDYLWREYNALMKYSKGSWYHDYGYSSNDIKQSKDVEFSIDKITFSDSGKYDKETVRTIQACWKMGMQFYDAFESSLQCIDENLYYFTSDGIYRLEENGKFNGKNDLLIFKNPKNNNIYDFVIDVSGGIFTVIYGTSDEYSDKNATRETYNIADYFCKAQNHMYVSDEKNSNSNEKVYVCCACHNTIKEAA